MKHRLLTTASEEDTKLLRRPAKAVKNVHGTDVILGLQDLKRIAEQWEADTRRQCDGLAAVQIGLPLRIVIVRKTDDRKPDRYAFVCPNLHRYPVRAATEFLPNGFCPSCGEDATRQDETPEWVEWEKTRPDPWLAMINPRILKREGVFQSVEGCLSVPGVSATVLRAATVFFKYQQTNGQMSSIQVCHNRNADEKTGLRADHSAAAIEHEVDHLLGVLITDKASEVLLNTEGVTL